MVYRGRAGPDVGQYLVSGTVMLWWPISGSDGITATVLRVVAIADS